MGRRLYQKKDRVSCVGVPTVSVYLALWKSSDAVCTTKYVRSHRGAKLTYWKSLPRWGDREMTSKGKEKKSKRERERERERMKRMVWAWWIKRGNPRGGLPELSCRSRPANSLPSLSSLELSFFLIHSILIFPPLSSSSPLPQFSFGFSFHSFHYTRFLLSGFRFSNSFLHPLAHLFRFSLFTIIRFSFGLYQEARTRRSDQSALDHRPKDP